MTNSSNGVTTKLRIAVTFIADRLKEAGFSERPNSRGRVSNLAPDIYVKAVAEKVGVTVTHMSRIITGQSRPGMGIAIKLADLAKCSVDDVLAIYNARVEAMTNSTHSPPASPPRT
jgi:hypothetical protein